VRTLLATSARCATNHPALRIQSDERLVELAAGGFEPAFELLVSRHWGALMRYSGRLLAEDRAEDVVQLTFIRAYEAITSGHPPASLRPWLFRVAHNAALDSLKDRALRHSELDENLNGVERPDQAFERSQSLRDVVAAVSDLPSRQRDAIVLRELDGRSYEDIALEMGVTGGAVRQLLARARTTVRATCSALTPYGVVGRVPWSGSEPVSARVTEMVAGTGAPVVVAHVCAVAILASFGGGVAGPQRAQPDAPRAGSANPQGALGDKRAALPPITSESADRAIRAARRLTAPSELRDADDPAAPPALPALPQEPEHESVPVKLPVRPAEPRAPALPHGPGYDYAYPGSAPSGPPACLQRLRARSACEALPEAPAPEDGAQVPPESPPLPGPLPADAAPADPPPSAEPAPAEPTPAGSPPPAPVAPGEAQDGDTAQSGPG